MPDRKNASAEAQLVERAICGDNEAFGNLYQLYLDAIYRYIYFRVGSSHDAEDLTEQTFLQAWEALPNYRKIGHPFTSWLYTIAHNIVVDFQRKQKPLESLMEIGEEKRDQPQPGLLGQIVASEEQSILVQAIAQLNGDQQQVIILRFVEGMSHNEIAQIMNKSEGACRMIQYRALAALSQLLQPMLG